MGNLIYYTSLPWVPELIWTKLIHYVHGLTIGGGPSNHSYSIRMDKTGYILLT
jgi:hypothetical protein